MSGRGHADLERRIGYRFDDQGLLKTALVHRSRSAGAGVDNERLEFLGDAVVGLVIADLLQRRWPGADEGQLSRRRAALVNAVSLAAHARRIDLGVELALGRGEEKTGGRQKDSILAGAYEALLGAVYLDGGFSAAYLLIEQAFAGEIEVSPEDAHGGAKTQLQELTQGLFQETPAYELVAADGPDHAKEYEVEVRVQGRLMGSGRGRSKKSAEQKAAAQALLALAEASGQGVEDAS